MRVGIGYDIHALRRGKKLVLGCVEIPFEKGLTGHSDGDCVSHAVVDAILGAMNAGDIGTHFPDKDERFRGMPSSRFLQVTAKLVSRNGLKIENVDCVVIAEQPKLTDWKAKMAAQIARHLGIDAERVSVKAKTNEGFGDIGKNKAIACNAVASLSASRREGAR